MQKSKLRANEKKNEKTFKKPKRMRKLFKISLRQEEKIRKF